MVLVVANKQSGKRYHELGCDVNVFYVWMNVIEDDGVGRLLCLVFRKGDGTRCMSRWALLLLRNM